MATPNELIDAARVGDCRELTEIISIGVDTNVTDKVYVVVDLTLFASERLPFVEFQTFLCRRMASQL